MNRPARVHVSAALDIGSASKSTCHLDTAFRQFQRILDTRKQLERMILHSCTEILLEFPASPVVVTSIFHRIFLVFLDFANAFVLY